MLRTRTIVTSQQSLSALLIPQCSDSLTVELGDRSANSDITGTWTGTGIETLNIVDAELADQDATLDITVLLPPLSKSPVVKLARPRSQRNVQCCYQHI